MNLRHVSAKGLLISVYAIILLMFLVLPQFKYSITYVRIIFASIPFFVIFFFENNYLRQRSAVILLCFLGITFFRFIFNTPFEINASMNTSIILYLCILPFFIFEVVQCSNDVKNAKIVAIGIIVMLFLIGFKTFSEFATNPTVARLLAHGTTDDEYINLLRSKNIGGFGFSYSIGMLVPYLMQKIVQSNGMKKIGLSIILAIAFSYIILSQYTTLLLLSIFFVIFVLLTRNDNILLKIVVLILTAALLLNLEGIFTYLSTHISLESLSSHFADIAMSLSGGESSSSRSQLYTNAIELFLQNPIFGVDITNEPNAYIINHSHSTFFGTLASGGIVGTALYYYCYFKIIQLIKDVLGDIEIIKPVFYMFIVLSVLNPISHFEICTVVFLLIPLLEYIGRYNREYDNFVDERYDYE